MAVRAQGKHVSPLCVRRFDLEEPSMRRFPRGFTLAETLVAIAVVGILMALLLPAIQAAREAARRVQCQHNLHQMGIALHSYHDAGRVFPAGLILPNRTMWSGLLLPYLEQRSLHAALDSDEPWSEGFKQEACSSYLPIFRCPSSTAPRHLSAQGIDDRVPCNYLACTSGTVRRESGPPPLAGQPDSNGIFYINSGTRLSAIFDGASCTVAVGETIFSFRGHGADHTGMTQFLDHWYIGTGEGRDNEVSESLGSTGVAVNSFALDVFVDEKELDFSSRHPGGAHVLLADGAVAFVSESINRATWTALGTRAGGEVVGDH
jgi:prepilin-type N-terminal cleavage/methylation domain-containing protein/prepilin-type processing-associated H-X9-DG protein